MDLTTHKTIFKKKPITTKLKSHDENIKELTKKTKNWTCITKWTTHSSQEKRNQKGLKKKMEHNNNKSEYIELNQKIIIINTTIEQIELKKL